MNPEHAIHELQNTLEDAKDTIQQQNSLLRRLTALPQPVGTIVEVLDEGVLVNIGGNLLLAEHPTGIALYPSDVVCLTADTHQIIYTLSTTSLGETGEVKAVHETGVEVDIHGSTRFIVTRPKTVVKIGDKVIVDDSRSVVRGVIPGNKSPFTIHTKITTTWDEIGGLESAKLSLKEAVEAPIKYKELYQQYNKKPVKGILLWGPPGCGKTLLAKAVANSLAALTSSESAGYLYVKGPELLDKYVGSTEQQIRAVFKAAREYGEEHQTRAVLFIDEAEAIMRRRGSGVSSDVESTIVPAFLAEMDGLEDTETSPLVLLATNRPDTLDPAIIRDGRIDRRIKISRPDRQSASRIFKIHAKRLVLHKTLSNADAINIFMEKSFEDRPLFNIILNDDKRKVFHFRDLMSGAIIAGMIERAISSAFNRDINRGKFSGVTEEDIHNAVSTSIQENIALDLSESLQDFCAGESVRNVERITQ